MFSATSFEGDQGRREVTDQGAKSFVVVHRIGEKPAIYTHVIGRYPAVQLADTRTKAREAQ